MSDDRQGMAAKINALLSKTIENGATEEEAMLAMAKATELMAKYEFNMTSAQIEAQGLDRVTMDLGTEVYNHASWHLATGIMKLAEVRAWREHESRKIVYFGLRPDIIFAKWVHENLSAFCEREATLWWKQPGNYRPAYPAQLRAKLKMSFVAGCAARIVTRMYLEVEARKAARQNDQASKVPGTALVVIDQVKRQAIDKALADMKFSKAKNLKRNYDHEAKMAGSSAADRASWNKGVNSSDTKRLN